MVEALRCGKSEKCMGRPCAHGRYVGQVDRKQPLREDTLVNIGREVDSGDLGVDGDDMLAPLGENGRIITDKAIGGLLSLQPSE